MNADALFRVSGIAAVAGGALRIVSAFQVVTDPVMLEWLYTAIDVLLTFAMMGIYLSRASKLGMLGLTSFGVAIAALSFISGPDSDPFGFSTYEQGAATLVIALLGLSLAWLRAGERPLAPPLLWIGTALAGGVMGALPAPLPNYGFMLAGVLFGAAFIAAGLPLVSRKN